MRRTISRYLVARPTPTAGPMDSVDKALGLMQSKRSYATFVVDDDRLIGIFTEHDFLTRVLAEGKNPAETRLTDVMTADPEVLTPDDDIAYAINKMAVGGFRNVPIVSSKGAIRGLLTANDVISHLGEVFDAEGQDSNNEWIDIGGG